MNGIEKSNSLYARYEKLLLERDALRKEAGSILTAYIKTFGALIVKIFEKKVDCISKKKSIAFCQAAANRGEMIRASELRDCLSRAMEEYQKRLEQMVEEYKEAAAAKISSEFDCVKSKMIYRRIAKLIHPDINPKLWERPEIAELWDRAMTAYGMNDVSELQTVEVLLHKILDDNGFHPGDIVIDNIEQRIKQLEAEIIQIMNTDPYLYKDLLEDETLTARKKKDLEEEYESYAKYAEELKAVLKAYLKKGVIVEWEGN